LAMAPEKPPF